MQINSAIRMNKMTFLGTLLVILAFAVSPVLAAGQGTIRISPALPVMVESPATFEIWIEGGAQPPANDPHILLVMSKSSYDGLTGDVVITWTGGSTSFSKADFTGVMTGFVPSSGARPGGRYTVASLQDHLGRPHSENVYYALGSFLAGPITHTPQSFTVTFTSTHPRMLVYALGKSGSSTLFDNKVPPTIPGFVLPELGPVVLALASFSALGLYAFKRRKI
jgi:hypothetical protein